MQLSQVPYLERKLPPPVFSAHSKIAARQQSSHVLAMSWRDIGCEMLLKHMLNIVFAFTERSSESPLQPESVHINKRQQTNNYPWIQFISQTQKRIIIHNISTLKISHATKYPHLTSTGILSKRTGEQFGSLDGTSNHSGSIGDCIQKVYQHHIVNKQHNRFWTNLYILEIKIRNAKAVPAVQKHIVTSAPG